MLICVCISSYESKRILKYCFADDFFHIIFHEHLVLLGVLYRGKHALASMCVTDKSQYELLSSSTIFLSSPYICIHILRQARYCISTQSLAHL